MGIQWKINHSTWALDIWIILMSLSWWRSKGVMSMLILKDPSGEFALEFHDSSGSLGCDSWLGNWTWPQPWGIYWNLWDSRNNVFQFFCIGSRCGPWYICTADGSQPYSVGFRQTVPRMCNTGGTRNLDQPPPYSTIKSADQGENLEIAFRVSRLRTFRHNSYFPFLIGLW